MLEASSVKSSQNEASSNDNYGWYGACRLHGVAEDLSESHYGLAPEQHGHDLTYLKDRKYGVRLWRA